MIFYIVILKNDTEYVKNYKISEGSKIMLMGSKVLNSSVCGGEYKAVTLLVLLTLSF